MPTGCMQVLLNLVRNAMRGRRAQRQPAHARRARRADRRRPARARAARGRHRQRPGVPEALRERCSCRWYPGAPTAPASAWRWRSEIAREHGGSLAYRSQADRANGVHAAPAAGARRHGMSRGIWIVDDDRSVRFVLGEALREAGPAVREFGDAATCARPRSEFATPDLLSHRRAHAGRRRPGAARAAQGARHRVAGDRDERVHRCRHDRRGVSAAARRLPVQAVRSRPGGRRWSSAPCRSGIARRRRAAASDVRRDRADRRQRRRCARCSAASAGSPQATSTC